MHPARSVEVLNSPNEHPDHAQPQRSVSATAARQDPLAPGRPPRLEIWGFLDDSGVGRALGGAVGVMYYQAMQVAFVSRQNIDRVDLALASRSDSRAREAALSAQLGSGFTVEPPARKGDRVAKRCFGVRSALTVASLIALLVGAFLIHNTMAISVVQRKREIGILRAIGSTAGR